MPYIEDLFPTIREDSNLVNNKLTAWPQNLKNSKTFKRENISKNLPKSKSNMPISPFNLTSSRTLKSNNNKIDP